MENFIMWIPTGWCHYIMNGYVIVSLVGIVANGYKSMVDKTIQKLSLIYVGYKLSW